ncbi:MAG: Hsp33 family molecular chaperone HslO [Clostridia bacterium]|nr:Hsp33 family molecular chaperone HslO [Clostridia bacterium]
MMDRIVRAITPDGFVKASAVESTELCEKMRNIHKTLPVATAALGRALSAASMMGSEIKDENGSVTLQIKGGGPLGAVTAVSDSRGCVRGYVQNPALDLPLRPDGKLDVGGAVGADGILTVIKDIGAKEPFSGKVGLLSGEIAEDIAAYFAESEQIPTVCALGVLVAPDQSVLHAGGYIIQLMPGAPESLVSSLEEKVIKSGSVTRMMEQGLSPEGILKKLLGEDLEILETSPVGYECKCSKRKVERALVSMGERELQRLIDEGEKVNVTCQFCDASYDFTADDLKKLLDAAKKSIDIGKS